MSEENMTLLNITENQSEKIHDLFRSTKHAKEPSDRLNQKLCDTKQRFEKEKLDNIKECKADIKRLEEGSR